MNTKKQKKLAKKAYEEFINSGYVIEHLRQIFRMQDYSDKDVIAAFKFAIKEVREANEEKWNFVKKKKKDNDEDGYEEFNNPFERTKLNPKDKTKLVGRGKTTAILEDLDSLLG